jgi:hypothetical protein
LSGVADVAAGLYTVRVTVTDDDGGQTYTDIILSVLHEDASVEFDDENPVGIQVDSPGGDSESFSMTVYVTEAQPDEPVGLAMPGNIGLAEVSMDLVPVGPGNSFSGTCTPDSVIGTGYDAELPVTCSFDDVAVNTYSVEVTVEGNYCTGYGEDVLVVYDPSLGFTTGGGWFYWPETADRTTFGYTMKYNKKATNVKGSLLLIRHLDDGSILRIKSNALFGLAIGEVINADSFGWASFSGKATFLDSSLADEALGNYTFVVYVEDHGEPGAGVDQIWIEIEDRDGIVEPDLSMPEPALDNVETLEGGNIVVPHNNG